MGKAIKVGDDVSSEYLIPGPALHYDRAEELAPWLFMNYDKELRKRIEPGDILVAGRNLGCGSSREHAPLGLVGNGFSFVIAHSMARIFYRNCINVGLPAIRSPEAAERIRDGDELEVRLAEGKIYNLTRNEQYAFQPFSEQVSRIIEHGGVVGYVRSLQEHQD